LKFQNPESIIKNQYIPPAQTTLQFFAGFASLENSKQKNSKKGGKKWRQTRGETNSKKIVKMRGKLCKEKGKQANED
jgi:hypothetical protein